MFREMIREPAGISIFIAGLIDGALICFASVYAMKCNSATTYSVVGSLNKIPLTFLGIIIFKSYPTTVGWVGIAIGLSGGVYYAYLMSNRPKEEK
jgi:GDP-mannose transporter